MASAAARFLYPRTRGAKDARLQERAIQVVHEHVYLSLREAADTHSSVLPDNIRMFQHVVARRIDVSKALVLPWQSAPWSKEEKANSVHGDAAFPSKRRRSQIRYVDERTARHRR